MYSIAIDQGTAFLSFSTDTIDEVRKEVESAKIQNAKTIQTNTV